MSRTTVAIAIIKENIDNVSGYGMGLTADLMESISDITRCYANDKVIPSGTVDKLLQEIEYFNTEMMMQAVRNQLESE